MKVADFSSRLISARALQSAGYGGVMLYAAPGRESWMQAKQPPKHYIASLDKAGIKVGFVWQFGGAYAPDALRGYGGGVADAKAAQRYLQSVGKGDLPVIFAVDFNISLHQWNSTAVEYFMGAMSVLGRRRMGIYGHSRVVHWAREDNVVAEVAPGRVLGWVTKSWSLGATGSAYAALYQHTHNVAGPEGVQIDINSTYHQDWGWRAIPHRPDMQETRAVDKSELPRFDTRKLMAKHYTKGRTYNGKKHSIKYVTRHHVAGLAGLAKSVDGRFGCWDNWQDRAASAHAIAYQKVPGQGAGIVGQLVRPEDTAWSNSNSASNPASNPESYAIEHQNHAGATQDWPIHDEVLKAGAEHAAEILYLEALGEPVFGENVRDHQEFSSTSCPYHLREGGKYHNKWMDYCRDHYRRLTTTGGLFMSLSPERQEDLARKIDRIDSNVASIKFELTHKFDSRKSLELLKAGKITVDQVFNESAIGYALEDNRKIEDLHQLLIFGRTENLPDDAAPVLGEHRDGPDLEEEPGDAE
ncbi:glycoside hydrolase domain-containing protein [Corynebacterium sp.]|uniref:glycoside hydrolase domain-containing protein n=1 Tax=Corynebacterium sp. TaxID=1720 RepID=UPI0028A7B6A9|nr:glycoside hydrolase domain-containing protein [Corynebacterium sp.]